MKTCPTCNKSLAVTDFYMQKRKDGLSYECKSCTKKRTAARRQAKPEIVKAECKKARLKKPEYYAAKEKEKSARWVASGAQAKASARFIQRHPDRHTATQARRRAQKLRATPIWANKEKLAAFYTEARRLTLLTGVLHVVDHVIPLKGRKVSGLHVETNLQILDDTSNKRKSNKHD